MILVCAADDFRKFWEISQNYQFLKIHKKSVISKMSSIGCFSSRLGKFQAPVLEFDKNCTQNAYFKKK